MITKFTKDATIRYYVLTFPNILGLLFFSDVLYRNTENISSYYGIHFKSEKESSRSEPVV